MKKQITNRTVDLFTIAIINLFNLIMILIFYLRTKNVMHPLGFGVVWGLFILLLVSGGILNQKAKRDWWATALPLIFALFLIMELILDYFLQIEFRSTSLLVPYLILYYLSILGMIGYAFLTDKKLGTLTLATYFLSQIAAIYSYIQVGHG